MRISSQVFAAVLLFAGLTVLAIVALPNRAAVNPDASIRSIAASPSGFFVNSAKSVDFFREQILRRPEIVSNYTGLAQLLMQLAAETGDELRYIPEARRLIEESLKRDPADFSARVLEASLLNKLHRFDDARNKLSGLIADYPQNSHLRALLVDALVELGEYEEAVVESDVLQRLKPGLPSYSRAAYLRELHGDNIGAIEAMAMAARAGSPGSSDRSWALYQLAQLHMKQGDTIEAGRILNGLLDESPTYNLALAGLAGIALAEERYEEATELARNGYNATGGVVFIEIELEALSANPDKHDTVDDLVEKIQSSFHSLAEMGENIDMEYADFLADHDFDLKEAKRLIESEVKRRPNHLHVLETSAWVDHKLGRSIEALQTIQRAMRLGTRDAKLYYRASIIAEAAGRSDLAETWQRNALEYHLKTESIGSWREIIGSS